MSDMDEAYVPDQIVPGQIVSGQIVPGQTGARLAGLLPTLRGLLVVDGRMPILRRQPARDSCSCGECDLVIGPGSLLDDEGVRRATESVRRYLEIHGSSPQRILVPGVAELIPEYPRGEGPMAGKVVMVTGAAQGFGFGIARGMAAMGAHVVIADINGPAAGAAADRIGGAGGSAQVVPVTMNVADPESTGRGVDAVVSAFGGIDVYVSNAGVVRAGGVAELSVDDFDQVTRVNYRGYFIGVRAVAPVMAAQHAANPQVWGDIIEVNSKSGLVGSKKNFAYSGSKFGGIGLTQSFALELVESGIKVNAVCPGNFLDGPLWQDPDHGLLVQYLRAGKVPGATTVQDVLEYYEGKVPIGRGCRPEDVLKAICYAVEQQYETGQAIPVTGGQTMLG